MVDQVQAEPEHRSTSDLGDHFDDSNPGNPGNNGRPGQPHGALDMSTSRPAPSLSSDVTYGLSDYGFGGTSVPSVNQGPSPASHTIAPHEWNTTDLHLGPLLDNFGPTLFTGDTNSANLTGLARHDLFSNTIGNYQGNILQFETELGRGG
jgi:hypothetical protein